MSIKDLAAEICRLKQIIRNANSALAEAERMLSVNEWSDPLDTHALDDIDEALEETQGF